MLLTKPNGKVVDVDDEESIRRLKAKGFTESTEEETREYRTKKEMAIEAQDKPDPQNGGVYYQSVSQGGDGYGMSRDIIKTELFSRGVKLEEEFAGQKVGLLYAYPYGVTRLKTDVRLVMTMFESDKIPDDWAEHLEQADEVIVPSKWCADTFERAGIKATVVPLGYNDRVFKFQERTLPVETGEPYTFVHYGSFNTRKGFFEVLEAFTQEFGKDDSVRLILKTVAERTPVPIMPSEYPNVEVIKGELSEQELAEMLGRANCMVYPSRGEGFGITPLEAMATGLPAIVPNAHGITEYYNPNYMLEVKVAEKCPALYNRWKHDDVGEMVICDIEDLKRQMRYCVNNQAKVAELGKQASEYVKRYTYQITAERLAEIINKWKLADVKKRKDSNFLEVEQV